MDALDVSQLPVHDGQQFVGAVTEDRLVPLVLQGQDLGTRVVREVMESPFPTVDPNATIDHVTDLLQDSTAILVVTSDDTSAILTKADVVHAIAALAKEGL
jgi:cystathionine beta-synthase